MTRDSGAPRVRDYARSITVAAGALALVGYLASAGVVPGPWAFVLILAALVVEAAAADRHRQRARWWRQQSVRNRRAAVPRTVTIRATEGALHDHDDPAGR